MELRTQQPWSDPVTIPSVSLRPMAFLSGQGTTMSNALTQMRLSSSPVTRGDHLATNTTSLLTSPTPMMVWDWSGEQYNLDAAIGR